MNVLFLEAYCSGSHQAFMEGWKERSRHRVHCLTLPGRKWKWRMQTGAWIFAREAMKLKTPKPDVIIATDMINLAEFLGLTRSRFAHVPTILYFHENQYSYPPQIDDKPDYHWGVINAASALAADRLIFNSEFHRRDFFKQWRKGNKIMPDARLRPERIGKIQEKALVVPVGVDTDFLDAGEHQQPDTKAPPLILWNHRWEHDKKPDLFFDALRTLKKEGVPFRLAVCGESFASAPSCFEKAREEFHDETECFGYMKSREAYARLLWEADIVVSTAVQEFLGISVIEAAWCGCRPLLPERLNYPWLLPQDQHEQNLYRTKKDLIERLHQWLRKPEAITYAPRQDYLKAYTWKRVAKEMDKTMEKVHTSSVCNSSKTINNA
ncbi:MAG: DUF3524 domain-containing protein [Candidatus Sumerlaeia bacterium]